MQKLTVFSHEARLLRVMSGHDCSATQLLYEWCHSMTSESSEPEYFIDPQGVIACLHMDPVQYSRWRYAPNWFAQCQNTNRRKLSRPLFVDRCSLERLCSGVKHLQELQEHQGWPSSQLSNFNINHVQLCFGSDVRLPCLGTAVSGTHTHIIRSVLEYTGNMPDTTLLSRFGLITSAHQAWVHSYQINWTLESTVSGSGSGLPVWKHPKLHETDVYRQIKGTDANK